MKACTTASIKKPNGFTVKFPWYATEDLSEMFASAQQQFGLGIEVWFDGKWTTPDTIREEIAQAHDGRKDDQ